ncbi:TPA: transglutaminase-like cysteine peptidase [Photobacterium damselae]
MSISKFKTITVAVALLASVSASASVFHVTSRYVQVYGSASMTRLQGVNDMIKKNLHHSDLTKLEVVNSYYNQNYRYLSDNSLWGQTDYWASAQEFIGANAGDCEDFAIAKYQTLRKMGVKDSKLRLVYVDALQLNQTHMVLAYYKTPRAIPLVLDSLNHQIKPASERHDLKAIYSFNAHSLWLNNYKHTHNDHFVGNSSRLSAWSEVFQRTGTYRAPITA